jgi:hypothetical protein
MEDLRVVRFVPPASPAAKVGRRRSVTVWVPWSLTNSYSLSRSTTPQVHLTKQCIDLSLLASSPSD